MDNERLQETKDYWCRDTANYSLAGRETKDICELVAAVEEARAELKRYQNLAYMAMDLLIIDKTGTIPTNIDEVIRDNADLRKQLATVVEEHNDGIIEAESLKSKLSDCRRKFDEAKVQISDLDVLLAEAQAGLAGRKESNKRYHKQMCDKEDERRITRKRLDETEAELAEVKSKAWKTVDLKEGNLLTFVGVHVLAWQQEWGQPKIGFTRWNDDND